MIPTFILTMWLSGLLSLAFVAGAVYSFHRWYQDSWGWDAALAKSVFAPDVGWNASTGMLFVMFSLVLVALFGRPIVVLALRVLRPSARDSEPDPRQPTRPSDVTAFARPDGSTIHVEFYGPTGGIPLVCTHGWGLDSREWNYLKTQVPAGFRLVVWDLPGAGHSLPPANKDFTVEKYAADLHEVIQRLPQPAVLIGHSIGGMITLTLCHLFPGVLERSVAGIVLTHTTPTNPLRTTSGAPLLTAIETPVLIPLLYLTIGLSPLLRLMNWLAYFNGTNHLMNLRSSFGGTETWQQIDFSARFQPLVSPAVLARGMLGMLRYDAMAFLHTISVPILVVTGNRDSTTKPEAGRVITMAAPKATLLELSPAKHMGLIEHHHRYLGAIFNFCGALRPFMPQSHAPNPPDRQAVASASGPRPASPSRAS